MSNDDKHNENDNPITRRFRDKKKTRILSTDFDFFRKKYDTDEFAPLPEEKGRIALFIMGMKEHINFGVTPIVTLGRFPHNQRTPDQIDLTDFGGIDKGVSRIHCQLEYRDDQIIVTDLGSTNGTYVAGKRLDPNQPIAMERGAEFIIGRLPVQIISDR